jgi:hypothetical protein
MQMSRQARYAVIVALKRAVFVHQINAGELQP